MNARKFFVLIIIMTLFLASCSESGTVDLNGSADLVDSPGQVSGLNAGNALDAGDQAVLDAQAAIGQPGNTASVAGDGALDPSSEMEPMLAEDGSVFANGAPSGTEYNVFWFGDLRIFALKPDTEILMIDVDTGLPLSFGDPRLISTNFPTNPFVLLNEGDSFEGIGMLGSAVQEIRVKIFSNDATGNNETKPINVWTGGLGPALRHPDSPPTGNPWMSYIPAFVQEARSNGREVGRQFLGFTSSEMYIFALKGATPTSITVDDLVTNTDSDSDDSQTLAPGDAIYTDQEIEIYFLDQFEDDTVRVTSNVDISVLVGLNSKGRSDWTATPPSYAEGEGGFELGTLFYTFANRSLTVFPVEDNTTVNITDLSDGDDSISLTLANGDVLGGYDIYTPILDTISGSNILPRVSSPKVNIFSNQENPFDNDFVKVESDKPILVYVGPAGSDVFEFADVAYAVPTGPGSFIVYAYAQNGIVDDLQIFGFSDQTIVNITSLSQTSGFQEEKWNDFDIGPGIGGSNGWLTGIPGQDVWWGSGVWNGEMLRIESNGPFVVINGDYDAEHFGAYVPFALSRPPLPPIADAGVDQIVSSGVTFQYDGTGSFDQDTLVGTLPFIYEWDFDLDVDSDGDGDPTNDVDATGPNPTNMFTVPGRYRAQLTYFDDEGEWDTDVVVITLPGPPDLVIAKTDGQDTVNPGDLLTYDLTISNISVFDASGVLVNDILPAHTSFVSASNGGTETNGVVSWPLFNLPDKASVIRSVTVQVNDTFPAGVDSLTNTATVIDDGSNGPDPNPANNTAMDVNNLGAAPDLSLTKDDGEDSVQLGDTLAYQITISNVGTQDATGVTVADTLPPGTTFVSASDGGVEVNGVVTWPAFTLPAGTSVIRTVTIRVNDTMPAGVDSLTNTATVTDDGSNGPDPNPADNTATDVDNLDAEKVAPDLQIIKDDGGMTPSAGEVLVYTLSYANVGTQGATGVVIQETVPANTTFNAAASSPGWSCPDGSPAGTSCTFSVGALDAGSTGSVDFAVTIDEGLPIGTTVIDNITLIGDDGNNGPDLNPNNNQSTASTTIVVLPPVCDLYPIALHEDTLIGVVQGDLLEDIWNGAQPGNFGWLTWTGANRENVLATSLTPPGDSDTYINPYDPADTRVSIGDWVEGRPGVTNSRSVRSALDLLKKEEFIIVPVWDMVEMNGANTNYHVINFAKVRLTDYQLPNQNIISAEFIEIAVCRD